MISTDKSIPMTAHEIIDVLMRHGYRQVQTRNIGWIPLEEFNPYGDADRVIGFYVEENAIRETLQRLPHIRERMRQLKMFKFGVWPIR